MASTTERSVIKVSEVGNLVFQHLLPYAVQVQHLLRCFCCFSRPSCEISWAVADSIPDCSEDNGPKLSRGTILFAWNTIDCVLLKTRPFLCTTDVSSREEDKSAKLPECRDQKRSLEWGTRLTQVACPHQNINFTSLRGVSKASQPCCEREPKPKKKKQQFVSKFKCSYDSRWRLKIPVRVAALEHWCLWFCWYSETQN